MLETSLSPKTKSPDDIAYQPHIPQTTSSTDGITYRRHCLPMKSPTDQISYRRNRLQMESPTDDISCPRNRLPATSPTDDKCYRRHRLPTTSPTDDTAYRRHCPTGHVSHRRHISPRLVIPPISATDDISHTGGPSLHVITRNAVTSTPVKTPCAESLINLAHDWAYRSERLSTSTAVREAHPCCCTAVLLYLQW